MSTRAFVVCSGTTFTEIDGETSPRPYAVFTAIVLNSDGTVNGDPVTVYAPITYGSTIASLRTALPASFESEFGSIPDSIVYLDSVGLL